MTEGASRSRRKSCAFAATMIVEALMAIAPTAIGTRTIPHQPPVREGDDCRGNSDVEKDRGRTIRQGLSPKGRPSGCGPPSKGRRCEPRPELSSTGGLMLQHHSRVISTRDVTPSFPKIWRRWKSIVCGESTSWAAASRFVRPSATSSATVRSVSERLAHPPRARVDAATPGIPEPPSLNSLGPRWISAPIRRPASTTDSIQIATVRPSDSTISDSSRVVLDEVPQTLAIGVVERSSRGRVDQQSVGAHDCHRAMGRPSCPEEVVVEYTILLREAIRNRPLAPVRWRLCRCISHASPDWAEGEWVAARRPTTD